MSIDNYRAEVGPIGTVLLWIACILVALMCALAIFGFVAMIVTQLGWADWIGAT